MLSSSSESGSQASQVSIWGEVCQELAQGIIKANINLLVEEGVDGADSNHNFFLILAKIKNQIAEFKRYQGKSSTDNGISTSFSAHIEAYNLLMSCKDRAKAVPGFLRLSCSTRSFSLEESASSSADREIAWSERLDGVNTELKKVMKDASATVKQKWTALRLAKSKRKRLLWSKALEDEVDMRLLWRQGLSKEVWDGVLA